MHNVQSYSLGFDMLQNITGRMQKNLAASGRVDRYMESLKIVKLQGLSTEVQRKLEVKERLLKHIKKQIKEHKLTAAEVDSLYESCFVSVKQLLTYAENIFKEGRSDFQAVLFKRKQLGSPELKEFGIILPPTQEDRMSEEEISERCLIDPNFEIQRLEFSKLVGVVSDRLFKLLIKADESKSHRKADVDTFLRALSASYNVVPYHNFTHAAGVFLMFCYCYHQRQPSTFIDTLEMLFGGVACLGHDLRHQGLNNLYHAKTKSNLAVDYSYAAPLERMHLREMNRLMEKQGKFLLEGLSKEDAARARRVIARAILSTDMVDGVILQARHYNYVQVMKQRNSKGHQDKCTFSNQQAEDRQYLLEVVTHGCDIGNPCLSFPNYIHWANFVCIEFHEQTLKEQAVGVEATSFLKFSTLSNFYMNQSSFTSTVVLPLWLEIAVMFPELEPFREQISSNVKQINEAQKEQLKKR